MTSQLPFWKGYPQHQLHLPSHTLRSSSSCHRLPKTACSHLAAIDHSVARTTFPSLVLDRAGDETLRTRQSGLHASATCQLQHCPPIRQHLVPGQHPQSLPPGSGQLMARTSTDDEAGNEKVRRPPVVAVSLLQPRVAVVLGVPKHWHYPLSLCRLLSIAPAILWGLRFALRFLITDFLRSDAYGYGLGMLGLEEAARNNTVQVPPMEKAERRLRLTETALSIIWCGASGYLAFTFTDSLMSRWLLNYAPHATIVRLFTLCCIYSFISQQLTYLLAGDHSPALLLPAWIGIATTLTACYHVSQRQINIRKETRSSISIFSIASFISMVALLVNLHLGSPGEREYPDIPLAAILKKVAEVGGRFVVTVLGVNRERDDL